VLSALIHRHLHDWLAVEPAAAGMQLIGLYRRPLNQEALLARARKEGLNLTPLSRYYLDGKNLDGKAAAAGLYLGYAGVPREAMEESVLKLQACFRALSG
jgi:DNA-binding transcriptional MocR family regulator